MMNAIDFAQEYGATSTRPRIREWQTYRAARRNFERAWLRVQRANPGWHPTRPNLQGPFSPVLLQSHCAINQRGELVSPRTFGPRSSWPGAKKWAYSPAAQYRTQFA